ncbi:MAG: hypothetical protein ABH952_04500 [Candidatus Omnitrophota bacterium]
MSDFNKYKIDMEIGQLLLEKSLITPQQLEEAQEVQRKKGGLLGEILVDMGYITTREAEKIYDFQDPSRKKIGRLLIELGIITHEHVERALKIQSEQGGPLGQILIQIGAATEEDIVSALATQFGFPYLQLSNYEISEEVLKILPLDFVQKNNIIPIDKIGNMLTIAVANPLDEEAIDLVEKNTGCKIEIFIAKPSEIKLAIEKYYLHKSP